MLGGRFIEASNGVNWGKFFVGRFAPEMWAVRSQVGGDPLLRGRGWTPEHVWVLDLQTGEGAWFRPGGHARADLGKHRIWVCPLFEPFLVWLYQQDTTDLAKLPAVVELPEAPAALYGHRRRGPDAL